MADHLNDLFHIEDEFYKEGYDAGVADSAYAGMVEGKVFGIEKGYEKAMELARLRGRALVWKVNSLSNTFDQKRQFSGAVSDNSLPQLDRLLAGSNESPTNSRLQKHVEALLKLTDSENISNQNSDDAVTEFDDRLAKARAKVRVIANIRGEAVSSAAAKNSGIEDATGLTART